MPRLRSDAEVLAEVGVLAISGALNAAGSRELIREMREGPRAASMMTSEDGSERRVYPDFARSKTIEVSSAAHALVANALARQGRSIEAFFGQPLELSPELHFLLYEEGDFILPHVDTLEGEEVPDRIRERVALFSLFVNGGDDVDLGGYEGGEFVLHPSPGRRLKLPCKAGMLIVFRADLVHEVLRIRAGTRHSVAGWLRVPAASA